MTRDVRLYLEDILDSISKIERYIHGVDEQRFVDDVQLQDSVLRRLEVIGEATKNIPQSIRDKYPHIPWRNIAGLRDVLIHAYFGVNLHRTWKVVNEDIPDLRNKIQQVQQKLVDDNRE
jgi:uncharacterized protein with HEPN domain